MEEASNQPNDQASWTYEQEEPNNSPDLSKINISWTASEYISHQKDSGWYVMLGAGSVIAAIAVYVITQDRISSAMMVVVAVLFGIFAARKPKVLKYQITSHGITIGDKFYSFNEFKSFTVFDEGQISSVSLAPMKRFMPNLSIYYPPEQEEQIVGVVASFIPHEDREPDALDKFMHRVRF